MQAQVQASFQHASPFPSPALPMHMTAQQQQQQQQATFSSPFYHLSTVHALNRFMPMHPHSPVFPSLPHPQLYSPTSASTSAIASGSHTPISTPFACKWLDCTQSFASRETLVAHVNGFHLMPSELGSSEIVGDSNWSATANGTGGQGSSVKSAATAALLHQLLQDHIAKMDPAVAAALNTSLLSGAIDTGHHHQHTRETLASISASEKGKRPAPLSVGAAGHRHNHHHHHHHQHSHSRAHAHPYGVNSSRSSTPGPTTAPQPTLEGEHVCKWHGCSLSFESSADLMTHLSVEHVGSGKAHYECCWEGCERAPDPESGEGGRGFAQRQKVMRHLQTHTGKWRDTLCAFERSKR